MFQLVGVIILCTTAALCFGSLHKLLVVVDLENDRLNMFDASEKFNKLIKPEVAVLGFTLLLGAVSWRWYFCCWCATIGVYNGYLYYHSLDTMESTTVYGETKRFKQMSSIKLGLYIVVFVWGAFILVSDTLIPLLIYVVSHLAGVQ